MTTETPTAAVNEPMPLADVDLADLDNFTDGITPWRMFHTLRHQDPVHWQPEEAPNSGFWAVTRHADIARVDRDAETFTSTKFVNLEEVDEDQIKTRASILELDGVRHRAMRSLLQRQFGASVINSYTDFLRGLTATTLDAALAKGTFDFVKEVSADFPINVLARLLDVPPEDNQQLIDWGNRIIGNTDPDYADVLLDSAESEQYRHLPFRSPASLEVFEYGRELARQRRGGDGTDLVSKLVNTIPKDGVPLSPQDFDNYFLLLVVAGNETTRHTITHSMLALLQHPDQLARLKDDPSLIPGAVEEFLRWASPSTTSAAPPPRTSNSAASGSRRATRSSCGTPPATVTRRPSATRTTWMSPAPTTTTSPSARAAPTCAWATCSPAPRSASCSRS